MTQPHGAISVFGDFWIKQKARLFLPGAVTCAVCIPKFQPTGLLLPKARARGMGVDRYLVGREHLVQARTHLPKTHFPFHFFLLKAQKTTHVYMALYHDKRRLEAKKYRGKLGHGMTE